MENFINQSGKKTLLGQMFCCGTREYLSKKDIARFLSNEINEGKKGVKDEVQYLGCYILNESQRLDLAVAIEKFAKGIFEERPAVSDVVMKFECNKINYVVSIDYPFVAFSIDSKLKISKIKGSQYFLFKNPRYDEYTQVPKDLIIKGTFVFHGVPENLEFSFKETEVSYLPQGRSFIQVAECVAYATWAFDKKAMYFYEGIVVLEGNNINKFAIDGVLFKAGVAIEEKLQCLKIKVLDGGFILVPVSYPKIAFEFNYIHEAEKIGDGYDMNISII